MGNTLLKPFFRSILDGRLTPLMSVAGEIKSFYKLTFLAAAAEAGLLKQLAAGPATLDALQSLLAIGADGKDALEAWLQMGVRLQLLSLGPRGYALRSAAKTLARPENDAILALAQEVVDLHHKLIAETVPRLRRGERFSLDDQDGELIARSSRVLEPFQAAAIERMFPASGAVRLLEIGCGSGVYLRYAAERNPRLTALGVELQAAVAEMARANLHEWGLDTRVKVEDGDIRKKAPGETFDIVTLYNNIYYFPVEERVALLQQIGRFLKPGGFLLLTTFCQGGSVGAEALNLWAAATEGAGRLPSDTELVDQLKKAGYGKVETMNLFPGDRFVAFQGFRS